MADCPRCPHKAVTQSMLEDHLCDVHDACEDWDYE